MGFFVSEIHLQKKTRPPCRSCRVQRGCDLLIVKGKIKRSQPRCTRQLLQGFQIVLQFGAAMGIIHRQRSNFRIRRARQRLTGNPQEIQISSVQRLA